MKDEPNRLEVPINAELLEKANDRLLELGTTMEDAAWLLVVRTIEHGDEMLKNERRRASAGSHYRQAV